MILLWDFNGTILDDTGRCLKIENDMLKKEGFRPSQWKSYKDSRRSE